MKVVFSFAAYYFLTLLTSLIISAGVFMVVSDLTLLVAGQSLTFFNLNFFLQGIFYSAPFAVFLALGILILYSIVHREKVILNLFSVIFFFIFSWLLVIPGNFILKEKYEQHEHSPAGKLFVQTGNFFYEDGGVYYFSKIEANGTLDGVFIDLTGITGEAGTITRLDNISLDENFIDRYAENLIHTSIKVPSFLMFGIQVYTTLCENALAAWNNGVLSWLMFISFALLLFSCSAFKNISSWALADFIVVATVSLLAVLLNYNFYDGIFVQYADYLWLVNSAVSLLFIITGIVLYQVKGRKL